MKKNLLIANSRYKVKALVVRAAGTNCDQETLHALTVAGAECELVHLNQVLMGRVRLHPFHVLVFPGGFSYGDDISAGKVFALELRLRLKDQLKAFVKSKKLVIGVCNGFQILLKSGLLPGFDVIDEQQKATLTINRSGRFQCEWVGLKIEKSAASWLYTLPLHIQLPIAHGEGRFITATPKVLTSLKQNNQIVLRYAPQNPNGSEDNIAGICNKDGNVIGLMPHPERFLTRFEHPNWTAQDAVQEGGDGLLFWREAINYAKQHLN